MRDCEQRVPVVDERGFTSEVPDRGAEAEAVFTACALPS